MVMTNNAGKGCTLTILCLGEVSLISDQQTFFKRYSRSLEGKRGKSLSIEREGTRKWRKKALRMPWGHRLLRGQQLLAAS
eukprot:585771-Pelagomonas_calceolata.AAC.1